MMKLRYWLALASLAWATATQAAWHQASSKHFVVYINDTPEHALAFTTRLEHADKAMRLLRGIDDRAISANTRVTILVVPDASIEKLSQSSNVAGFYIPRASGSVAFVPAKGEGNFRGDLGREAVLFHEYAHHFMYSSLAGAVVPPWLSEGFAEFYATTEILPNGDVVVGKPPLYRGYGILEGKDLPVATLLSGTPTAMNENRVQMFYGRGWLMTHYLSTDAARRARLASYLKALASGTPPREAALILGEPRALSKALAGYLRALPTFTIPAAQLQIEPVTVRPLTPAEAAMMPAYILSRSGVDPRSAPGVAAMAVKAAAPFPAAAAAQDELAEAELDADRPAEAIAAANRALAADPASVHAMMIAGLARMAAARQAVHPDPKAFAEARGWFVRANHADPENPWPLEEYYRSFATAREAPTHSAEEGLLYAHELASFDPELALMAGYVELTRGQADRAKRALQPVAYDPHGGTRSRIAADVLAQIDAQGTTAAATGLNAVINRTKDGKAKT